MLQARPTAFCSSDFVAVIQTIQLIFGKTQTHKENIPDTEWNVFNFRGVSSLDQALASFLRRKRGDMTFKAFSQKVGLPPSTLHRLEQGQQSITLIKLQGLLEKLKCKPSDVFEN